MSTYRYPRRAEPLETCPSCGGEGALRSPAWAAWWELEDQLYRQFYRNHRNSSQDRWFASDELAELDQTRPKTAPHIPCQNCQGRGTLTSPPTRATSRTR